MSGENKDTPAVDVTKAVNEAVSAALEKALGGITAKIGEQLAEAIKPLADNQKVLADTLAALPPAPKKEEKAAEVKPLTAEDVTKTVTELLAQQQAKAATTAAREKVAAELRAKGVPNEFLATLPNTDKAEELSAASAKLVARWNEVSKVAQPDTPTTRSEGGAAPSSTPGSPAGVGNGLTEAQAKFAASIKLPA